MTVRSLSALALLLAACAAWETTNPPNTQPPAENPAPSHYAPPAEPTPEPEPIAEPTPEPRPEPTPIVTSPVTKLQAAIASVQLLDDCPDPSDTPAQPPAPPPAAEPERSTMHRSAAPSSMSQSDSEMGKRRCSQSMVQLSVQADGVAELKIEAVRVLAANGKKVVGSTRLRSPTNWDDASGTYSAWQGYTVAGKELKISYKMASPEFTPAAQKQPESKFNTYSGPFLLEIDVSVGGKRKTLRSPEFTREPEHVMVT